MTKVMDLPSKVETFWLQRGYNRHPIEMFYGIFGFTVDFPLDQRGWHLHEENATRL